MMAGNHRAALGLYDEFLLANPGDEVAPRVRLLRTAVDRLLRAEAEIQRLQQDGAARDEALARTRLELNTLRAETARLRADLERLKAVDLELERRTR